MFQSVIIFHSESTDLFELNFDALGSCHYLKLILEYNNKIDFRSNLVDLEKDNCRDFLNMFLSQRSWRIDLLDPNIGTDTRVTGTRYYISIRGSYFYLV